MLRLGTLYHGGIMANYRCTAACRHCLYACSPDRSDGYITPCQAREICGSLRKGGCTSVHIGGGEPFLDFEGLLALVGEIRAQGIELEYIETNAYWAVEEQAVVERLGRLAEAGVDALCISVDPFHAEYVPVGRPLLLAEVCRRVGMGWFLWKGQFVSALSGMDLDRSHSREELERGLSSDYVWDTAAGYGLHWGGRAVNIEAEYAPVKPVYQLLDDAPCRRLLSTSHFHVDLHGRFIPPGCTGFALPLSEAARGIPAGAYPVMEAALQGGVAALYNFAAAQGFVEAGEGYPSKCALCFHIRRWLSEQAPQYGELDREHYAASLSFY